MMDNDKQLVPVTPPNKPANRQKPKKTKATSNLYTGYISKYDGRKESVEAYEALMHYADSVDTYPYEGKEKILAITSELSGRPVGTLRDWYSRFSWPQRAREINAVKKQGGRTDVQVRIDQIFNDAEAIARLGAKKLKLFLDNLLPETLNVKEAVELGNMISRFSDLAVSLDLDRRGHGASRGGVGAINATNVQLIIKE